MRKNSVTKLSLLSKTLVSTILICVLAIISATSAGIAWNAVNKEAEVDGKDVYQIETVTGVTLENCRVYYYDSENKTYKMEKIDISGNAASVFKAKMITYDTVFPERNGYTPIILRIELTCIPHITTKVNLKVGCPKKTVSGSWVDDNGHLTAKLSNIVEINAASVPSLDKVDPDAEDYFGDIYEGARAAMTSTNERQFATVDANDIKNNVDKADSVNIDITGYKVTADNTAVVYIQYDYNEYLVKAFTAQNGIILPANYEGLNEGDPTIVDFPNDLETLIFTPVD